MSHDITASVDHLLRGEYHKAHRLSEAERNILRYRRLLAADHRTIDLVAQRLQAGAPGGQDIAKREKIRKSLQRHVAWCERGLGFWLRQR